MSYTVTDTRTFTVSDIETVFRRFTADLVMIAQSSGANTETEARDYAHDIELLAKKGYLEKVDLTLFSGSAEVCATQYTVNTAAGELTMSRPGGVNWPRMPEASLRIVLYYTPDYTPDAREAMKSKLKSGWRPTDADTSHATLTSSGGRDYTSNGWGLQRKDYSK